MIVAESWFIPLKFLVKRNCLNSQQEFTSSRNQNLQEYTTAFSNHHARKFKLIENRRNLRRSTIFESRSVYTKKYGFEPWPI